MTGANGFIGKHLVSTLMKAGANLTVMSRSRSRLRTSYGGGLTEIVGRLDEQKLLEVALQNQEIVFNLAYDSYASAATNVSMLEALLAACFRAGVGKIIHTSSIVVYDDWPNGDLDEESSMSRTGGSDYREAKIEMESRLMVGSTAAAILQPTIVYGPGSVLWTEQFLEWLSRGDILLPAPEGHCNGLFVDDLVQALLRAATLSDLGRERFIVSGSKPFPWSQLLEGYSRIVGSGAIEQVPLNKLQSRLGTPSSENSDGPGASLMAMVTGAGRRLFGRQVFERALRRIKLSLAQDGKMYPDQHLLNIFSATGHCRIGHARERLGFEPQFDVTTGLAAIASARARP